MLLQKGKITATFKDKQCRLGTTTPNRGRF